MKQIIKSNSNPSVILVDSIKDDYNLHAHGLYGIIARGRKYVLSVSDKFFTFAAGDSRWSSYTSFAGLLQGCLTHPDVQVFIFDDLKEYAEWILKD
jgi:hypothetical protein